MHKPVCGRLAEVLLPLREPPVQFRILTSNRRVGTRLLAFLREMIMPKVAVSRSPRALPARLWQLSRLTLACDAFDDRRVGVAWSGA